MNIIWIGGVAEQEDFNKMQEKGNNQIAANVTQLNYIEGLEENTKSTVKILSSHFQPSFPKYKDIIIKSRTWERKGKENIDIGFINLPIVKHIIKKINLKKQMKKILNNDISKTDTNIFFIYAMTFPLMSLAKFIKNNIKTNKYKICLIVPDLPEFMNMGKKSTIRKVLENVNEKLIKRYMKYIDTYVLFAENMADYLDLENNYISIEGMVNLKEIKVKNERIKKEKVIMYAGGLYNKYGVTNLAKAFDKLDNNEYELWLYGEGDAINDIKEMQKKNPRIIYKGTATNNQIKEIEKKVSLLVNPRPINEEYTKYSFPSKNLEYMLSGTAVLTTKLPAMPIEYNEYVYLFNGSDVNSMSETLNKVLSDENLFEKGENAKKFVIEQKNNIIQTEKILKFIEGKEI